MSRNLPIDKRCDNCGKPAVIEGPVKVDNEGFGKTWPAYRPGIPWEPYMFYKRCSREYKQWYGWTGGESSSL